TVVGKNIRERWRHHNPESAIVQRPNGVLPGRTASEILTRDHNRRFLVLRMMQHERRIFLSFRRVPPIVKQELTKPRTLDSLQELLRDNLVRIDVDAV